MMEIGRKALLALAVAGLCIPLGMSPAVSGDRADTPETIMARARGYTAPAARQALRLADRLYQRLATDRGFAARILAAVQNDDRAALARLIAGALSVNPSQVTIEELDRDVLIRGTVLLAGGTQITYCVDTENKNRCHGHGFSVEIAGA